MTAGMAERAEGRASGGLEPRGGLEISLLGPVEVSVAGTPVAVSQPMLRALLAVLALSANRVVPAGTLIESLWDEEPTRARERNLHVQVYQLRKRLSALEPDRADPRLITREPGYRLDLGPGELDITAFTALVGNGRQLAREGDHAAAAETLRSALALWRGPGLADVAGLSAALHAAAYVLEQQHLAALEDRIQADLDAGQHVDLPAELAALITQHPLRERLHAQLMLALYRNGRQADALTAYIQTRGILASELGIEPGPELRQLHQHILANHPSLAAPRLSAVLVRALPAAIATGTDHSGGKPGAATAEPTSHQRPVPRQLPSAIAHFTGRQAELKELRALLSADTSGSSGTVPISLIRGMGGVGKTALALHLAHDAAARFPDGQLFANLRGYHPSGNPATPVEIIRGFLDALGVPAGQVPASPEAQAGLYRTMLADRKMLIVLDNASDPGQVRPLLPASPGCAVLVTSRSVLTGLTAADGAYPVPLGPLTADEARQLIAARIGYDRTAAEPEAIASLIQSCGRLPLALAIMAARAAAWPTLPLAALAAELATGLPDRLDALNTGEDATSIRDIFSWSYRALTSDAARLFRQLGLHPGSDISLPATASLSGLSPRYARQMLTELTTASLLTEHTAGRYALHDLIRAYATQLALDIDTQTERDQATSRLLDHYLHTSYRGGRAMDPARPQIDLLPAAAGVIPEPLPDPAGALSWFRAEHQVLLAATALAATADFDRHAWQIPWTMTVYLNWQGHWLDWTTVNQTALAAAERLGDHAALGSVHYMTGHCLYLRELLPDSAKHQRLAVEHFALAGDTIRQAMSHVAVGLGLEALSDELAEQGLPHDQDLLREALDHAQQALAVFRQANDRPRQISALNMAGAAHARLGDFVAARESCQQALDLFSEDDNIANIRGIWRTLAKLNNQLGDFREAAAFFQQAADAGRQLGDRYNQADNLDKLGDAEQSAGRPPEARQAWKQALDILDDLSASNGRKGQNQARRACAIIRKPFSVESPRHHAGIRSLGQHCGPPHGRCVDGR
jgi:DNA-binding SARP family transcriptional activator